MTSRSFQFKLVGLFLVVLTCALGTVIMHNAHLWELLATILLLALMAVAFVFVMCLPYSLAILKFVSKSIRQITGRNDDVDDAPQTD